jgi:hypothetical protein
MTIAAGELLRWQRQNGMEAGLVACFGDLSKATESWKRTAQVGVIRRRGFQAKYLFLPGFAFTYFRG